LKTGVLARHSKGIYCPAWELELEEADELDPEEVEEFDGFGAFGWLDELGEAEALLLSPEVLLDELSPLGLLSESPLPSA